MTKTAQILKLHAEGKSTSEIAKELNIRYQHVYNTLLMKGLEINKSERVPGEKKQKIMQLLDQGLSINRICAEVKTYSPYVLKVKKEWKKQRGL